MSAKVKKRRPYKLSALPDQMQICAMGENDSVFALLRSVQGSELRSCPEGRYVVMPATRANCMAAEAIDEPEWAAPEYMQVRSYLMQPSRESAELALSLMPPIRKALLWHQWEFLCQVAAERLAFNAGDRGTGKTATGWLLSRMWNVRRHLILTVKSGVGEWESQQHDVQIGDDAIVIRSDMDRWTVSDKVSLIRELGRYEERFALVLYYEIFDRLKDAVLEHLKPDMVTYDESWKIKSPESLVSKAAMAVADQCNKVLLLNGSPFGGSVADYWTHLRMMHPFRGEMESFKDFRKKFVMTRQAGPNGRLKDVGCLDPVGLVQRFGNSFYRATKATCLELEPKQRRRVRVELSPEQEALYAAIEKDGEAALDESSLNGKAITNLRLQQVCDGFVAEVASLDATSKRVPTREIESAKLKWLRQWAQDELVHDESIKAIVWVKFNPAIPGIMRVLDELGVKARAITGDGGGYKATTAQLDAFKREFNSREPGTVRVGVFQIKKMAFTHNLQAADVHVKLGHTWSLIEDEQLEDRSHRQGREGVVRYIELEAVRAVTRKKTVDAQVLQALADRYDLSKRLSPDTTTRGLMAALEE